MRGTYFHNGRFTTLEEVVDADLLLHVVDLAPLDGSDPVAGARAIVRELERYDRALYDKPRWLVLNKLDLVPEDERQYVGHDGQKWTTLDARIIDVAPEDVIIEIAATEQKTHKQKIVFRELSLLILSPLSLALAVRSS